LQPWHSRRDASVTHEDAQQRFSHLDLLLTESGATRE
jgi:hypothetical protein